MKMDDEKEKKEGIVIIKGEEGDEDKSVEPIVLESKGEQLFCLYCRVPVATDADLQCCKTCHPYNEYKKITKKYELMMEKKKKEIDDELEFYKKQCHLSLDDISSREQKANKDYNKLENMLNKQINELNTKHTRLIDKHKYVEKWITALQVSNDNPHYTKIKAVMYSPLREVKTKMNDLNSDFVSLLIEIWWVEYNRDLVKTTVGFLEYVIDYLQCPFCRKLGTGIFRPINYLFAQNRNKVMFKCTLCLNDCYVRVPDGSFYLDGFKLVSKPSKIQVKKKVEKDLMNDRWPTGKNRTWASYPLTEPMARKRE